MPFLSNKEYYVILHFKKNFGNQLSMTLNKFDISDKKTK